MKHTIKISWEDGNEGYTDINGTDIEIINYYKDCNYTSWLYKAPQVKKIHFEESPQYPNMTHLFVDYGNDKFLQ